MTPRQKIGVFLGVVAFAACAGAAYLQYNLQSGDAGILQPSDFIQAWIAALLAFILAVSGQAIAGLETPGARRIFFLLATLPAGLIFLLGSVQAFFVVGEPLYHQARSTALEVKWEPYEKDPTQIAIQIPGTTFKVEIFEKPGLTKRLRKLGGDHVKLIAIGYYGSSGALDSVYITEIGGIKIPPHSVGNIFPGLTTHLDGN